MSVFYEPINLTVHPAAKTSITTGLIEIKAISGFPTGQSQAPVSNHLGECSVIFLLAVYIWVGIRHREYHIQKATNRLQQIDTVERILKRKK